MMKEAHQQDSPTVAELRAFVGNPPEALPECAKLAWREIVGSLPADWFDGRDRQLLQEYCLTTAIFLPQLDALIDAAGISGGALRTRDALTKRATQLARQLRLRASEHPRQYRPLQINLPSALDEPLVLDHCDV